VASLSICDESFAMEPTSSRFCDAFVDFRSFYKCDDLLKSI
jgi:hypothetical protein